MAEKPALPKKRRRLLIVAASLLAAVLGLWIAIHRVGWLGPMLADGARSVVGPEPIAWLENVAYAIDDGVQRLFRGEEKPQAYWDVPAESSAPVAPPPAPTEDAKPASPPPTRPADVGAIYPEWSAPGDGTWVPVDDPRHPGEAARMYKTLLHPDRVRAWSAVSIVAADLDHVDLRLVAGRYEPKSEVKEASDYVRPALIAPEHHDALLAAFNGGFKAIHGHYGMRIDGVTLIKARKDACVIALFDTGELAIRSWEKLADREASMTWWRQTPGCMYERGEMHVGLTVEDNTYWGSKIGGDTVIRRSAIGIDETGKRLFIGIGDSMTATALAKGMHHAGAWDVAQLDVNWSFPKLVLYAPREPGASELIATPLCKGFDFTEDEYIRERSPRDFFYLTRKDDAPAPPP